jgi:multidrug resistance efflux pump
MSMTAHRLCGVCLVAVYAVTASAQSAAPLRLHGLVEPVRSHPVAAPRLAGTPFQLIIVKLAKGGARVKRGDLLVEFDPTSQIKAARDREYEYRDLLAQLDKKRADQHIERATRQSDLALAETAVRRAELDLLGAELLPRVTLEKNQQTLEEATAKRAQLQKTNGLKERSAAADLKMLEIQRDRAKSAWDHATRNAAKMRITAPLDGLVVLKSIWKSGSMGEVQEGEEVRAGIPILEVVDPTAMRVRANVNQADVARLTPGAPVRVTLDSYPAKTFPGRVEYVSPVAIASVLSARVRTFLAVFSVAGTDEHLLPDLAAAIDLDPAPSTIRP